MPPGNFGQPDLQQSGKLSIEDVLDTLKKKPFVYECQLDGCKRLGKHVGSENLDVTLSQQDCVLCLLRAMKTFPDRPDLLKSAAKCLAKLTAAYEASSRYICTNDGLTVLMKIFRTYNDNVSLLLLIMDVLGNISLNEELSEHLVQSAIHSEILATMSRHSEDSAVAKQCCFILGNLVNSVEIAQSLMFVGGVHAIISTMERFANDLEVIENGCRTLGCFAMHDDICQDVGNAGALNAVISGMRFAEDNIHVQECGCWAIACLTKIEDTCREMCELDGLNPIITAMGTFEKEEVIQEYGCWIISNMSATESTDQVAIVKVLKKLMSAMLMFPENIQMQQQICFAISQIATNTEIQGYMTQHRCLQTIVRTMTSFPDDREIQEHCCRIIGNVALNETLRESIDCNCVSKAVVAAMLTLDRVEQIQEYGCMALTNLTANVVENKTTVIQNGAISAVLNGLKEFSNEEHVVLCGIKTLANLMELAHACSVFIKEDGINMLSNLLNRFRNSSEIRLFVSIILSDLSVVNDLKEESLEQAEEILFQSLDDSSTDPDVHLCICQFFEKMVLTEKGCERFIRLRRMSRIVSAMKLHSQNMEIHYSTCKTIATVAMYNGKGISIITEEVIELLVQTIEKFNTAELQTICIGVISYIIENIENACEVLKRHAGMESIITVMRNNICEERLQTVGLMAFESWKKKKHLECDFELTVDVMSQFPDNSEIQLYGCNVISLAKGHVSNDKKRKAMSLVTDILRSNKCSHSLQMSARHCLKYLLSDAPPDIILSLKSKIPSMNDTFWDQILETTTQAT